MDALRLNSVGAVIAILGVAMVARAGDAESTTFERHVRPILKAYCLDCHGGGAELKGKLDLRLARTARFAGGRVGRRWCRGSRRRASWWTASARARCRRARRRSRRPRSPSSSDGSPRGPGRSATSPRACRRASTSRPRSARSGPSSRSDDPSRRRSGRTTAARVRTPIDAFLLAELRRHGSTFAPEADRLTLLRRAAFDLTGLPPTPDLVDAFLADRRPDAYERAIDRLLDSPHYGERWARHWLDVAGYADSDGDGSDDTPRPYAYKYRDYVIRSFNADKPLDRFIVEQLAGDELVPAALGQPQAGAGRAAGGHRLPPHGRRRDLGRRTDQALASNQVVADTLKIVGSSLLGLTVGCAQCHDHRYDPIPQSDYYRLRAVFEPALDPNHWRRPSQRLVSLYTDADRAKAAAVEAEAGKLEKALEPKVAKYLAEALEKELTKFPADVRGKLRDARNAPEAGRTAEQKQLLASHPSVNISEGVLYQYNQAAADDLKKEREKIAAVRAKKPVEDFVSVLDEVPGVLPETQVFHRGDHRQPVRRGRTRRPDDRGASGGAVRGRPARTPGCRPRAAGSPMRGTWSTAAIRSSAACWPTGSGCTTSAGDWSRRPAISARWGRGPTHPELLDWLASELVRQGWSLKRMHRLIMTSTAYRQSSRRESAGADAVDAWYGRYPVRRLDAEALRDRVLDVSGRLDRTLFGRPVPVAEDAVGQVNAANDSPRRSLYLEVRRTRPVSLLAAFDAPVMAVNCDRRMPSTSAPQSLMLMNSDFVLEHAKAMARRLRAEAPPARGPAKPDLPRMIDHAWTPRLPARDHGRGARLGPRSSSTASSPHSPGRRPRATVSSPCSRTSASNS